MINPQVNDWVPLVPTCILQPAAPSWHLGKGVDYFNLILQVTFQKRIA